jgi:putative lipoic acid-binding regulatory protein
MAERDVTTADGKNNGVEELLQFPCEFPLKVFGLNEEGFEQVVLELVRGHCEETTEFSVTRNESRKGKYQSLTITFIAHSRQQLDGIYQSLTDCEQVVMSL